MSIDFFLDQRYCVIFLSDIVFIWLTNCNERSDSDSSMTSGFFFGFGDRTVSVVLINMFGVNG